MPYSRKLVNDSPSTGEPVIATTLVTAVVAFIVTRTGIDSDTVETAVLGVIALIGGLIARSRVTPVK